MKHLGYIIAYFVILLNVHLLKAQGDVKIGYQVWTSKNLDVSTFRNGEAIPEAKSQDEWVKAGENKQPAWCYCDNDIQNGKKYGKLYNWYAVIDPRGLAPKGYHIPSDAEWTLLTDFLGGENKAGKKMKSKAGWNNSVNGNNSSGFNGLPVDSRNVHPGDSRNNDFSFCTFGLFGSWWSSTEDDSNNAWCRFLNCSNGIVTRSSDFKVIGFSVRCLRD
jgi:uncharacterized protein (TIGR02145 family)